MQKSTAEASGPRKLDDVPGWFRHTDKLLFEWLLSWQTRVGQVGDLLELGVYEGKSAIHMGQFLADGEKFTVCDLFDLAGGDQTIRPGARKRYKDLTREKFERNYLAFHEGLPIVVQGRTAIIVDHVAPNSCRFTHIDASHMYEHVRGDLLSARKLLQPDGIVVFDDYRTEHCPGTAAAVWEAMATEGLRVICVSANKFYGTWGDPDTIQKDLIEMIAGRDDHRCDLQSVMGQRLVRVVHIPKNGRGSAPLKISDGDTKQLLAQTEQMLRVAQQVLKKVNGKQSPRPQNGWRRLAVAVLPPVMTDTIRRIRRRRALRS